MINEASRSDNVSAFCYTFGTLVGCLRTHIPTHVSDILYYIYLFYRDVLRCEGRTRGLENSLLIEYIIEKFTNIFLLYSLHMFMYLYILTVVSYVKKKIFDQYVLPVMKYINVGIERQDTS